MYILPKGYFKKFPGKQKNIWEKNAIHVCMRPPCCLPLTSSRRCNTGAECDALWAEELIMADKKQEARIE